MPPFRGIFCEAHETEPNEFEIVRPDCLGGQNRLHERVIGEPWWQHIENDLCRKFPFAPLKQFPCFLNGGRVFLRPLFDCPGYPIDTVTNAEGFLQAPDCVASFLKRSSILLIGGDKHGHRGFYENLIREADKLYCNHLRTLKK
jgi:hypothetical protein